MEPDVPPSVSDDNRDDGSVNVKCQRCNNLVKSCLRMKQIIVEGESVFKLYAQKCREIDEAKKSEMTRHWESSTEVSRLKRSNEVLREQVHSLLSGKSPGMQLNKKSNNQDDLSQSETKITDSLEKEASSSEKNFSKEASTSKSQENADDETDDNDLNKIVSGGCPENWRAAYMKLYRSCVDQRQQQGDQSSKSKQLESEVASLRSQLLRAEQRHKDTEQKLRVEKKRLSDELRKTKSTAERMKRDAERMAKEIANVTGVKTSWWKRHLPPVEAPTVMHSPSLSENQKRSSHEDVELPSRETEIPNKFENRNDSLDMPRTTRRGRKRLGEINATTSAVQNVDQPSTSHRTSPRQLESESAAVTPNEKELKTPKKITRSGRKRSVSKISKQSILVQEEVSVQASEEKLPERDSSPEKCRYKALLRSALDELYLPSFFISSCSESDSDDAKEPRKSSAVKVPLSRPSSKRTPRPVAPSPSDDISWSRRRTAPSVFMPRKRSAAPQITSPRPAKKTAESPAASDAVEDSLREKTSNESEKSALSTSLLQAHSSHNEEKKSPTSNVPSPTPPISHKDSGDEEIARLEVLAEDGINESEREMMEEGMTKTVSLVTKEDGKIDSSEMEKDVENRQVMETDNQMTEECKKNVSEEKCQSHLSSPPSNTEAFEKEKQETKTSEIAEDPITKECQTKLNEEQVNNSDSSSDVSDIEIDEPVERKKVKLTTPLRKKVHKQLKVKLKMTPKRLRRNSKALQYHKDVEEILLNEELSDENLDSGGTDAIGGNGDDISHVLFEVLGLQSKEQIQVSSPKRNETSSESEHVFNLEPPEVCVSAFTSDRDLNENEASKIMPSKDLLTSKIGELIGMESNLGEDTHKATKDYNVDLDASVLSTASSDERLANTDPPEVFSPSEKKPSVAEKTVDLPSIGKSALSGTAPDTRGRSLSVIDTAPSPTASKNRKLFRQRSLSGQFLGVHLGSQCEENFYAFTSKVLFPMLSPLRDDDDDNDASSEPNKERSGASTSNEKRLTFAPIKSQNTERKRQEDNSTLLLTQQPDVKNNSKNQPKARITKEKMVKESSSEKQKPKSIEIEQLCPVKHTHQPEQMTSSSSVQLKDYVQRKSASLQKQSQTLVRPKIIPIPLKQSHQSSSRSAQPEPALHSEGSHPSFHVEPTLQQPIQLKPNSSSLQSKSHEQPKSVTFLLDQSQSQPTAPQPPLPDQSQSTSMESDSCTLGKQKLSVPPLDSTDFLPWMVTKLCQNPDEESAIQGHLLHFCENDSSRLRLRDCFPLIGGLLAEQQDVPKFVMHRFLNRETPFNPSVDVTGAALTPLEGRLFRSFAAIMDSFPTLHLPRLLFDCWRLQLLSETLSGPARCSHIRFLLALLRHAETTKVFNWRSQILIILSELATVISAEEVSDLLAAALSVYPELAPYPSAEAIPQVGHLVSTAMAVALIELVKKEEEEKSLPLFWRICHHCNWPNDFRTELGGQWSYERLQYIFQTSTARHTSDWLRDETFFALRLVASLLGWHWTYTKLMRPLVTPMFLALPQLPTASRCGLVRLVGALGPFCNHSSGADQVRDLMAKLSVWFRDGEATRVQQEVRPVELGMALDCLLDLAPFQPHLTATAATCWLNNLQWAHAEAGGDRSERIRSFAVIFQEEVTFVHNALVKQ